MINQVPVGTFYGPNYLHWPFAQDFWAYSPYLSQVAQGSLSNSPFNETHWNDPAYVALYNKANATVDRRPSDARNIGQMQRTDFDRGGYIIAAYNKQVDLMSTRVNGFVPAGTGVRRQRRAGRTPGLPDRQVHSPEALSRAGAIR